MALFRQPWSAVLVTSGLGWFAWLLYHSYARVIKDPIWFQYPYPVAHTALVIGVVLIAASAHATLVETDKRYPTIATYVLVIAALVTMLLGGLISVAAPTLATMLVMVGLAGLGQLVCKTVGYVNPARWLSILVGLVVIHHTIFFIILLGLFNRWTVLVIFAPLLVYGIFALKPREVISDAGKLIGSLSRTESVAFVVLIALLWESFTTAMLPQTHTDALVHRLPYLNDLIRYQAFPPHLLHWARLISQPLTLLVSPGYLFWGEQGAMATLLTISIACAGAIYSCTYDLSANRLAALLAVVIFFSTPPVWIITTMIFNDIGICAYVLAGSYMLWPSRDRIGRPEVLLAGVLFAFALCIKLNAILIVCILALPLALLHLIKGNFTLSLTQAIYSLLAVLIVLLPSYLLVYHWTGNPLFPFLPELNHPEFREVSIFSADGLKNFHFNISLSNLLLLPWDLSFNTARFGEYLNGTFGISLLLLLPLSVVGLLVNTSQTAPCRMSRIVAVALLLPATLVPIAVAASIGMLIFRYTLPAFAFLLIGATSIVALSLKQLMVSGFAINWIPLLPGVFSVNCLIFLLLIGGRLNYGVPSGVAGGTYFSSAKRQGILQNKLQGIDKFINSCSSPDEGVISAGFFSLNSLRPDSFLAATRDGLFGSVSSLKRFNQFLDQYNIRFWIVDHESNLEFLKDTGIVESYLTPDRIVFGSSSMAVYDLQQTTAPIINTISLSDLEWSTPSGDIASPRHPMEDITSANPITSTIPIISQAGFARGSMELRSDRNLSVVIVDLAALSIEGNRILHTMVSSELGSTSTKTVRFFVPIPDKTALLQLQVRPWRAVDGAIQLINGSIDQLPTKPECDR